MAAARQRWREDQPSLDPARLVFIDETGTSTNMVRTRGRAPRGRRLVGRVPHGHWKITTFVAGLRCGAVTAPFVIDQPMNGVIFLTYIRRCLVPTLVRGDIVIMDNLKPHKAAGVREAIEAVGAKLRYLLCIRPISTRSSFCSPNSKRSCAKPLSATSTRFGPASENCWTPSPLMNAPPIFVTRATLQIDRNLL